MAIDMTEDREDFADEYALGPGHDEDPVCMSAGCDELAEWKLGDDWLCEACNRREMQR